MIHNLGAIGTAKLHLFLFNADSKLVQNKVQMPIKEGNKIRIL